MPKTTNVASVASSRYHNVLLSCWEFYDVTGVYVGHLFTYLLIFSTSVEVSIVGF